MYNFINKNSKILVITCSVFVSCTIHTMRLAPYQQHYRGKRSTITTIPIRKNINHALQAPLSAPLTIPQEIASISNTLKNAQLDSNFDIASVGNPLGYSQPIVNNAFEILSLYLKDNNPQNIALINKIDTFSLDELVKVTNFIEILDLLPPSNNIIDVLIDRISTLIDIMTNTLYKDLSLFKSSINQHTPYLANIALPYYQPLQNLNPNVEKKMKQLYATRSLLFTHIGNIWRLIGINTQPLENEKNLFTKESNTEPLAHFINRNVKEVILPYIYSQLAQDVVSSKQNPAVLPEEQSPVVLPKRRSFIEYLWSLFYGN